MESFQERTEEATPKRLKEAKKEGNVPFSDDLFKASFLLSALLLLWALSSLLTTRLERLFSFHLLHSTDPLHALKEALLLFAIPLAIIMTILFLLQFALSFLQRGFLFVTEKQKKTPSKRGKTIQALFFLLKGGVMIAIALLFLRYSTFHLTTLFFFALFTLLALLVLGVFDFLYQRIAWRKSLMMTKQEVQEEQKESEVARRG